MSTCRKQRKEAAPVLRLATHRNATENGLSHHQRLMLETLDDLREMVLAGEIDGMLYYCSGKKEAAGVSGRLACRGLEGDMDFVMSGMYLRLAMMAARIGRL